MLNSIADFFLEIIALLGIGFYILIGTASGLLVLALLTPLIIHLLINQPGIKEKSGFHLFTMPEEGKVKLVVRGDVLVRMIMLYSGHRFAREGERTGAPYWEILDAESGKPEESPLADIHWLFKPWAWYVYQITGAVFTGIYPFQTVREYPLERVKMTKEETPVPNVNNVVLSVREDFSDHFRARQFLFPFRIVSADTKDKIPLAIVGVIKAEVTNPHKAAFGTDRWDKQLVNMTTNAITNFARYNEIDKVLSAENAEDAERINQAVLAIKDDTGSYGIDIKGVDIIDISPILPEADLSKLHAEALAIQVGKATLIDGRRRAEVLGLLNEETKKGGEFAIQTQQIEGLVRAAEAAKNGTVLLPMGLTQPVDPVNAALLAELKKLNKAQQQGA